MKQNGHTLLELIMATSIVAATLVPALAMLRDGMELSRELDRRNLMSIYCVSKLEEKLATVAATWTNGTSSGDFVSDGHPDIRFSESRSDNVADGGIPDQLMNISVTVYDDNDQDDLMGSSENHITYRTKIAKLATYQDEAGS